MTGIPCGNPERYKSRGVIRMTRSDIPYENQQIGIPGQGTESEAEKELQNLIKNQLNASADYARKKLNFTAPGRGGEQLVPSARGFLTLQEFQKVSEGDKESNHMRGLGFSDHQINHLLTQKGLIGENLSTLKTRKVGNIVPHPDFVRNGIKEMMEAKEAKEAELEAEYNFEPMKNISRHMAQLESAILQNKKHPLANMYHKKAQGNKGNGDEQVDLAPVQTKRRKNLYDVEEPPVEPKKLRHVIEEEESPTHQPADPQPAPSDTQPAPAVTQPAPPKVQAPPPPPKPVVLTSKIDSISEEAIAANRVSEEKILEQFPNYERGAPSKVLYLKNLDKQVGVKELVSLFIRFQAEGQDKLTFKLMDGRMKGQAFVTFHDEPAATAALELVHGYTINDKPIIIQYGKAK
jgi:hypothetical protein